MKTVVAALGVAAMMAAPAAAQHAHGEHRERAEGTHGEMAGARTIHVDSVAQLLQLDPTATARITPHVHGINEMLMHMTRLHQFDAAKASDAEKKAHKTRMDRVHQGMEKHHAGLVEILSAEQQRQFMEYVHARMPEMTHGEGHDMGKMHEGKKKPGGSR